MEKIIERLRKNGFAVTTFATAAEAAEYICGSLHGKTIGFGGSETVAALGIYDRLKEDNKVYWHRFEPGVETQLSASNAQVYITSANAVSEEGYLLNIDGNGNRLAGTLMKKERVIFVVGKNKLSGPFPEALERARNVAAPLNAKRLEKKTPCAAAGHCFDCSSPERICNALLVFWKRPYWCETMEVVLIDEDLGF